VTKPDTSDKHKQENKKISYCLEGANHTTLSGTALLHNNDGYSRHGNFGGLLVPCLQYGFHLVA